MSKILITGGTGLVGTRLTEKLLEREYEVVLVSRNCQLKENSVFQQLKDQYGEQLTCGLWNPDELIIDNILLDGVTGIINLGGENIAAKRWTEERKKEIIQSRINANNTIVNILKSYPNNTVNVVVNASAIGYYGDDKYRIGETPFKETTSPGNDFVSEVCVQWENTIQPITTELDKRLVILRTGIVLSNQGGFLKEILKSLHLRVASVLGTGHQIVSWIHIDDLCELYIGALEVEEMNGVYNAVVPFSVTNERMVKTIANNVYKGKYAELKVPKTILKIAYGELSDEIIKSSLVSSKKVLDLGFSFRYPRVQDAIDDLVK